MISEIFVLVSRYHQVQDPKYILQTIFWTIMPLFVPGVTSTGNNQQNKDQNQESEWMNKLLGKKLTESTTDAVVRLCSPDPSKAQYQKITKWCQSFAKQDLPKDHRVIEHGSLATQDHHPNRFGGFFLDDFLDLITDKRGRLNIHLSEDGTIHHVNYDWRAYFRWNEEFCCKSCGYRVN